MVLQTSCSLGMDLAARLGDFSTPRNSAQKCVSRLMGLTFTAFHCSPSDPNGAGFWPEYLTRFSPVDWRKPGEGEPCLVNTAIPKFSHIVVPCFQPRTQRYTDVAVCCVSFYEDFWAAFLGHGRRFTSQRLAGSDVKQPKHKPPPREWNVQKIHQSLTAKIE